jgi:hypothetical protein
MNKLIKIMTLVGAGLILGSVAGKFIRNDKIVFNRILGEKEEDGTQKLKTGIISAKVEDPENIFI